MRCMHPWPLVRVFVLGLVGAGPVPAPAKEAVGPKPGETKPAEGKPAGKA